ncbi:MAG: PhoX family phosphatase [Pseudomonadota bacterium]
MAAVMQPHEPTIDRSGDDSSENVSTNPTDNSSFQEIVAANLTRRGMMQGSMAVAAAGFLAPKPAHAGTNSALGDWFSRRPRRGSLLDFRGLTIADATSQGGKTVTVSPDYEYDVLIPWGTPIKPGIPEYTGDPATRPTAAEQENQIGIGHDGMWFYPGNLPSLLRLESRFRRELPSWLRRLLLSSRSGVLAVNHEFGRNSHVLGKDGPESLEDVRLSQAAHGVSCVEIKRNRRGQWRLRKRSRLNRRITVNTPVEFAGPVAHSHLLDNKAGNPMLGTVNNCGSGPTPWGTYITCEENFNGYFGTPNAEGEFTGADDLQTTALARYGFSVFGFGYFWQNHDPRFDLSNADYANESNRFGWCVEIDPFNPAAKPVKRTAMGRFKHEAVAMRELRDGRVAAYMGDDQRGDYIYKFESKYPWRKARAYGKSPLDEGKLYVGKFDEDGNADGVGAGTWIELTPTNPDIAAAGLTTEALVLTYARLAADAVGATKMDRPEWSTVGTRGEIYWTLTNNDRKDSGAGEVSESNPVFENFDGYIIETKDSSSTRFTWNMFAIARNTRGTEPDIDPDALAEDLPYAAYSAPVDGGENVFTDPDAAYADPFGRLYIGTDGGQPDGLQDQLTVFDTRTGEYKRLLMGVNNDEITGITFTPDFATLFTNTQHPGDGNPELTNFPAAEDGVTIPRDCTLVVRRKY